MKYGSKPRIDGPNSVEGCGKARSMTPGKQAVQTPAERSPVGKVKEFKPGKASVISPADKSSNPIRTATK